MRKVWVWEEPRQTQTEKCSTNCVTNTPWNYLGSEK